MTSQDGSPPSGSKVKVDTKEFLTHLSIIYGHNMEALGVLVAVTSFLKQCAGRLERLPTNEMIPLRNLLSEVSQATATLEPLTQNFHNLSESVSHLEKCISIASANERFFSSPAKE